MLFEIYILAWLVSSLVIAIWISSSDPREGSFTAAFIAIVFGMLVPPLLIIALIIALYEMWSERQ